MHYLILYLILTCFSVFWLQVLCTYNYSRINMSYIYLNCYDFGNLLRIAQIFFVETRKWEDTFLWYSIKHPKKCTIVAPFSKIFTIEVPKHDGQKEHVCLHNIFKFHDCSFCRFLAFHKRVKLNCKLVGNSLHGQGQII